MTKIIIACNDVLFLDVIPKWSGVDTFDTNFEWKFVHSLHSLGAKNGPMSITFILTHQGRIQDFGKGRGGLRVTIKY